MRQRIEQAVRRLILRNELASSSAGLETVVGWLRRIADDFESHGADVSDIRAVIWTFRKELQRRRGLLLVAVAIAALGCGPTRGEQLANCRIVARDGRGVTECLVMKYDWDGAAALVAGMGYQASLDSAVVARYDREDAQARQAAAADSTRLEAGIAIADRWALCVLERRGRRDDMPAAVRACQASRPANDAFMAYLARARRDSTVFPEEDEYLRLAYNLERYRNLGRR